MSDTALHTKYRPKTLDELIGHEDAVTRMRGMIASNNIPTAMLITGPTSVGKTTLARAFVSALAGGERFLTSADYKEINVADQRSIDDMRELVRLSKLRPMVGKKRVFVLDEAQALCSNAAAAACIVSSTLILTNKGPMTAGDLHNRLRHRELIYALSFNHTTKKTEWKRVLAAKDMGKTHRIINTFSNGAQTTNDHRVFDSLHEKYTEARYLTEPSFRSYSASSSSCYTLETNTQEDTFSRVSTTHYVDAPTVYDFQIEGNENFFIGKDLTQPFFLVHNCLLKPLEESPKDTLWVLCSMDPSKFNSGNGRAIKNRCAQFVLEPHTNKDLYKQALRIVKGEHMGYMLTEDKVVLKAVVKNANFEMRSLAQILEACQQYYNGLKEKPQFLSTDQISSVLSTIEASDDRLAFQYVVGLYTKKYTQTVKAVLNCTDGMALLNKILYMNNYLLNSAVLKGERNAKVWGTPLYREAEQTLRKETTTNLAMLAETNTMLVQMKSEAMQFTTSVDMLLTAYAYRIIMALAKFN